MKLADKIRENFKPKAHGWEKPLSSWLEQKFAEGNKFVIVNGVCHESILGKDVVPYTEMQTWRIHFVEDWLASNGFTIYDCHMFGGGDHQFSITITL